MRPVRSTKELPGPLRQGVAEGFDSAAVLQQAGGHRRGAGERFENGGVLATP
jgi:hypothetical protein